MKFAKLLFRQKIGQNTDLLTYKVPEGESFQIGQLVQVSLRGKKTTALVWEITNTEPEFKTQSIESVLIEKPLLTPEDINLIKWISAYYLSPLHIVIKLFIPQRIFLNKPIKEKQKSSEQIFKSKPHILTEGQRKILETILSKKENKFLIHGITGSGKTEIYSQLAHHFIQEEKQVLILVPEISLTPQTIEYFEKSLGIKATIINSKISEGERHRAWKNIWNNEAKLIIGSRSAIFAPFQKLGIIIIDEEHESSYKQENSPRYHTIKVAEKLCELSPQLKLVLGSATPSIETAERYQDSTLKLTTRINNNNLPQIEIIDLREEFKKQNYSIFSETLKNEILKTLEKKEQIILFLNRRGTASSVVCRDCGYSVKCKNCDLTMTYHSKTLSTQKLICHHCGEISMPPDLCFNCQGANIRFLGIGTQKIEEEILKEFPSARILRADKDTTATKNSFKEIYEKFRNNEADILIGTQMIAKGLHLPNVSLVGVILADIGLNIPNFNTTEKNFQLLTQVAGRAGRGNFPGKVIIQTYNPENIALICTQTHNFESFFTYERTQRKILNNPPFGQLAKIILENTSQKNLTQQTEELENLLWKTARENNIAQDLEINSYVAYISKLRGKHRNIILIKSKAEKFHPVEILKNLSPEYKNNSHIKIDIDPVNTN